MVLSEWFAGVLHLIPSEGQGFQCCDSDPRALERLTLIARITNPVVGAGPLRAQVGDLLDQVREAYAVDACVVRTLEEPDLVLLAATGIPLDQLKERLPAHEGISHRIIAERRPFTIDDVITERTTANLAAKARGDAAKYWFLSYAGAPLLVEDRVVGLLGIYLTREHRRFSESELNHLQIVANHIAISIVNDRLYRELEQKRSELQTQIHQREVAEERYRETEEQLRHAQRMDALGRLAGGVAHDFNNLLTAILGSAGYLAETIRTEDDAKTKESLACIDEAATRAAKLTHQLLAFSRRQPNQPTVLDLRRLVGDLTSLLRRLVPESIELTIQCGDQPCPVRADANQIEQVVINLVVNARDAIERTGRIEVCCERVPGEKLIALTVRDDGVGMSAEVANRVFEPFFTTKPAGQGVGLGLSTAYGIVQQAGGRITVSSSPGAGTSFCVELPICIESETVQTSAPLRGGRERGQEVVLVCEDETLVRQTVCMTLKNAGYTVVEAASGAIALQRANECPVPIDLLLTDMVMPGMDGRELADRLRVDHPGLRCLLVSGYLGEHETAETKPRTWEQVLPKPFTPSVLLKRVRDVIDTRVS